MSEEIKSDEPVEALNLSQEGETSEGAHNLYATKGVGSNEDRLNSIMKVDTSSLLGQLMDIEKALSSYHKQDEMPTWSNALVARIEFLERQMNKTPRVVASPDESGVPAMLGQGTSVGGTLKDIGSEERVLNKMKTEMEHAVKTESTKLHSKVSTLSLELDRLHKLLNIRPTTSELQQVVLTIHDMNRKLQDGVSSIQKNIRGQVHDKVAEETANILAGIGSSSELSQQSINLIAKKVDNYGNDITTIRKGTEEACEQMINNVKKCQFDMQTCKESVLAMEKDFEEEAAKTTQSFQNVNFAIETTGERLNEVKDGIHESLDEFKKTLEQQDALVKEQIQDSESKLLDMHTKMTATNKDIEDFRLAYEVDVKQQVEEREALKSTVTDLKDSYNETLEYITGLREFDVQKMVELQADQITTIKTSIDDTESAVNTVTSKANKLTKSFNELEEEMGKLPAQVEEGSKHVQSMQVQVEDILQRSEKQSVELAEALKRIEELEKLNDEMSAVKEFTKDIDGRLKQAQTTSMSLLEVTGDHDRRLEQVNELVDNSDAMVEQKMMKMQGEIMDRVSAKQAEVEALVTNLHENMEAMSMGVDGVSVESVSIGKTRTGGAIGGARPGSRGKSGAAAAGHHGTTGGGGSVVASQEPSQVLSQEEKREVLAHGSEFLADLCINFEEICVRKSYVSDLPSAMCENIAAQAQDLAAFIANITDSEAVQTVLRAANNEVEYDEGLVVELRSRKTEELCADIMNIVDAHNNTPGAVRKDARTLFMTQTKKALSLCMSKHDQVLVVGNSRFGRIKIPTCIACDRPLVEKVRQEQVLGADNGPRRNFSSFGGGAGPLQDNSSEQFVSSFGEVSGSPPPRRKDKGIVRLPQTKSEKVLRPNSSHGGNEANALRSNLKHPRPGNVLPPVTGSTDLGPESMM